MLPMIAKSITVLHTYPNKNRSSAAYAALLRTIRPAYPGMPESYVVIRFLHLCSELLCFAIALILMRRFRRDTAA